MRYIFRFVLLFCATITLSGCYGHERGFATGKGHVDSLPNELFLANESDTSGLVLKKAASGYRSTDGDVTIMMTPVNASAGQYWMQYEGINKAGKTEFLSFAAVVRGSRIDLLITAPSKVGSKPELLRIIRDDFTAAKSTKLTYKVLDLQNSSERREAQAFIKKIRAKQQKKAADKAAKDKAKSAPKPKAAERAGQFVFTDEKDVMTGVTKQFIYAFSNPQNIGKPPFVRLGCYARNDQYPLGLTVEWGQPLYDAYNNQGGEPVARVTTKFGDAAPIELGWSMSGTRTQTYAPGAALKLGGSLTSGLLGAMVPGAANAKLQFNWDNDIIHSAFWRQSTLAMRAYARSGQEITMVFDLADFRKVSGNFRAHCKR